jgi:hypothetical protein
MWTPVKDAKNSGCPTAVCCNPAPKTTSKNACLELVAVTSGLATTGFGFFMSGSRRCLYIAAGIRWLSCRSLAKN